MSVNLGNVVKLLQSLITEKPTTDVTNRERLLADKLHQILLNTRDHEVVTDIITTLDFDENEDFDSETIQGFGDGNDEDETNGDEVSEGISSQQSTQSSYEPSLKQARQSRLTFQEIEEIVKYYKLPNGKFRKLKSMKNRFRAKVTSKTQLMRYVKYVEQGGRTVDKQKIVNRSTYEWFADTRSRNLPIHDRDLRRKAIWKARELNLLTFRASPSWLLMFKRVCKIRLRKITKFVATKTTLPEVKL